MPFSFFRFAFCNSSADLCDRACVKNWAYRDSLVETVASPCLFLLTFSVDCRSLDRADGVRSDHSAASRCPCSNYWSLSSCKLWVRFRGQGSALLPSFRPALHCDMNPGASRLTRCICIDPSGLDLFCPICVIVGYIPTPRPNLTPFLPG
jgi:hypothetical protein